MRSLHADLCEHLVVRFISFRKNYEMTVRVLSP
jgi:hypothetical protein